MFFLLLALLMGNQVYAKTTLGEAVSGGNSVSVGSNFYRDSSLIPIDIKGFAENINEAIDGSTSESTPLTVYIPISSPSSGAQGKLSQTLNNYYDLGSEKVNGYGNIPQMDSSSDTQWPYLHIVASSDDVSSGRYVHVAAENDDGEYKIVEITGSKTSTSGVTFLDYAGQNVDVYIYIQDYLCGNSEFKCNDDLQNFSTAGEDFSTEQMLYIFSTDGNGSFSPQDDADPSTYPDGMYVKVKMSNKVPTPHPSFNRLRRGDTQLIAEFDGGNVANIADDDFYKVVVAQLNTASTGITQIGSSPSIVAQVTLHDPEKEGDVHITGLNNGDEYHIAIAFMNKFQLVSQLSSSLSETPLQIETFLKEKACYLLSAGFQTDHYVLDYFRRVRDNSLVKTKWGSKFIHWYYQNAPEYAPYVYRSKTLSWLVKVSAYSTYYLIRYGYLLALGLIVFILFWRPSLRAFRSP